MNNKTTPADPGAINLDEHRTGGSSNLALIAAVEALRVQLSDVKLLDQAACKRAVTAEMRVTEVELQLKDFLDE